ncbi:MAG TPA: IclR family transcriptional regulator [Acidimicrobiia bacterium]|nr:IclR family transcriptional regulator [Acidimicrobiia bacterium]
MSAETQYAVRSVLRVLDILDLLRQRPDGATLKELAQVTEMPKSSVFRYLVTLESRGYVERTEKDGAFRLSSAFISTEAHHLELLANRARPRMEELRDRFGETVNLAVLDDTRIIYLEIVESRRSMRWVVAKGDREHLHSTALGKAVAIVLDDEEISSILKAEGMPARTERTIRDPGEFLRLIAQARIDGYAIDDEENEQGGRCVAVPIRGSNPRAALSLSAPTSRLSIADAEGVARVLDETAEMISKEIA